ncbi:MOP flippase family protein [Rhizobium sp. LjRoot254]|uniref:MOP flippase family protein n=1 Tax=Rhizobium sp. LjRoot254 TaxID=3342297 RepID=UPI003ECF4CC1
MSNPSDGQGQVIVRGISWSFLSRMTTQLFQVFIAVITARLLSPEEFGLVGMILIFSGFAQVLADMGISASLVHRQDLTNSDISTGFWLQIMVGGAISLLFWSLAPTIAHFYALPELEPLTKIISLTFIFMALGQTQAALGQREYRFDQIGIASVMATIASGIGCISMAYSGWGVYSLAWQPVISAATFTVAIWFISPWRPSFAFERSALGFMFRYGGYLSGHTILNYWLRNGDNLVIGKALGAVDLGLYGRAYTLMYLPLNMIGLIVGQVMFPVLSRLQDDIESFRDTYTYALRAIAFVLFPLMGAVFVLSEEIIVLMFGEAWVGAAPVLRILSLVGLMQSIVFPVGWIFTGLGKTKEQFQLSIFLAVVFVVAMAIGVNYGILGVASAYAAWAAISAVANLKIAMGYIELSLRKTLLLLLPSLVESGIVILLSEMLRQYLQSRFPPLALAVIVLSFGLVAYAGICLLTRNKIFFDMLRYRRSAAIKG